MKRVKTLDVGRTLARFPPVRWRQHDNTTRFFPPPPALISIVSCTGEDADRYSVSSQQDVNVSCLVINDADADADAVGLTRAKKNLCQTANCMSPTIKGVVCLLLNEVVYFLKKCMQWVGR